MKHWGIRPSLTEGFWRSKTIFKILFWTRFHVFYTRGRTELGSLFSDNLRSFGERYLEPSLFPLGRCSNCLLRYDFRRKKSETFPTAPRRFVWRWGQYFERIASEIDLDRTGVCRTFSKIIHWRNCKRRWMPLTKWLGEFKKRGSDSPISRVKYACDGAETSFFRY